MRHDGGGGVVIQRPLDDLARMHRGTVNGAVEQFLVLDHPMLVVQKQAGEHFMRMVAHPGHEIAAGIRHALNGVATL